MKRIFIFVKKLIDFRRKLYFFEKIEDFVKKLKLFYHIYLQFPQDNYII